MSTHPIPDLMIDIAGFNNSKGHGQMKVNVSYPMIMVNSNTTIRYAEDGQIRQAFLRHAFNYLATSRPSCTSCRPK